MKISDSLRHRRPFFSFEFFPPKNDDGERALLETIESLRVLSPAFVSVTYGAGGSTRTRTLDLAMRIKRDYGIETLAHITCVGSSRAELRGVFSELQASGIENVLALRGDPPKGEAAFVPAADGFATSTELVTMLREEFPFCVGGGCYPETHPEAPDAYTDLLRLVDKVRAGTDFLVTQLFFDNDKYFAFVDRARRAGIDVPIVPGIMPITNYSQISRITAMCGATIPERLRAELEARRDQPEAVAELGVAFATLQCADLLERGAPGIHFYTLNRSPATRAVVSALLASSKYVPVASS